MTENKQEPKQENKMGIMPVGKLLVNMSAPLMASMLFQALYNIVDSIFVSQLNQDALNAVSLAFPIQSLMIAFGSGTGVGLNALISRALGEKDQARADRVANTGIFIYIVTALVFVLLGVTIPGPYFRFMTDNPQILNYAITYTTICLCMSFMLFAQMSGERFLQATGRTNLSMIPQMAGAIFNMIFDPILIFGYFGFPRLEVAGAAVATVFGQLLAAVIAYTLNIKKNPDIHLSFKAIRPHKDVIAPVYQIAIPSIIMQAVGSVMNTILNRILISFTEAATAAFGAYYKLQSFIFMPVFGMNSAIVPIISYNYGARKEERVKKTIRYSIMVAIGIMLVGTILFETIPGLLLSIFSPTEEMLAVGTVALRIIGIHFPLAAFCIVTGSICQALDKPNYAMVTSLLRQVVGLLPAAYLLSLTGNVNNVWWCFPIAEGISFVLNIFFLRKTLKDLKGHWAA